MSFIHSSVEMTPVASWEIFYTPSDVSRSKRDSLRGFHFSFCHVGYDCVLFVLMWSHFNKLTVHILYIIMVTVAPPSGQDSDFHNKNVTVRLMSIQQRATYSSLSLWRYKRYGTLKHDTHVIVGHITPKACALICCFHSSVKPFHNILDGAWL